MFSFEAEQVAFKTPGELQQTSIHSVPPSIVEVTSMTFIQKHLDPCRPQTCISLSSEQTDTWTHRCMSGDFAKQQQQHEALQHPCPTCSWATGASHLHLHPEDEAETSEEGLLTVVRQTQFLLQVSVQVPKIHRVRSGGPQPGTFLTVAPDREGNSGATRPETARESRT